MIVYDGKYRYMRNDDVDAGPIKWPKHTVTLMYDHVNSYYRVYCSVCGMLSGPYKDKERAENRKSTHDRGQDAGAD